MVALVAVATPDRVSSGRGAAVEDKRIRFDGVLRGDLGFVGLFEPPAGDDFPFDEFLAVSRPIETLPPSRWLPPPRQFDIRNHTAYCRVDFLALTFTHEVRVRIAAKT
jgi:hypothetical protein